ncbi:MFS transporter [Echinimonas agarilytica]|uniref:MFS transporter n=1 Tax=Echinimonas agarilytica TaxID=1215918 RepID=A0AA42B693_9GAMM|nr:MFS transporter [Echinimonas agarilytica]MCM2678414.1 MFS transporter [Echinimonas agarilytica]
MIRIKEKIGYGLGDTASNIVFQVVINFLMIFYTDVFGISAAAVGTLMLVVRLFDAITDPVMGGIADRTNTRWGRYRPYMLYTSIPYAILAVLAFTTPDLEQSGKLLYAYVTYALLMTIYTAINIPYSALGGVLTDDPKERTSIQSFRFAMAMAGGAIVTSSFMPLVEYFGGEEGNRVVGYQYAMGTLSVLAVGCFLLCFFSTRERVQPPANEKKTNMLQDLWSLRGNKPFVLVVTAAFFLLILTAMRSAAAPYYMTYVLEREDLTSFFLTSGMIAALIGALCTNFISQRVCKVGFFKFGCLMIVVTHLLLYVLPGDYLWLCYAAFVLANFCQMIVVPINFSMVADTADYGSLKTGKKIMGMSFSAHLLVIKLGLAVGGALTGWLLSYYGYVANQAQTEESLAGIMIIFAGIGVIVGALMWVVMYFYTLTDDRMVHVHQEMEQQRSA